MSDRLLLPTTYPSHRHTHAVLLLPATQITGCHLEIMNLGAVTWKETESLMTVWGHHTALGCLHLSVSERKMLSFFHFFACSFALFKLLFFKS